MMLHFMNGLQVHSYSYDAWDPYTFQGYVDSPNATALGEPTSAMDLLQ